SNAFELIWSTPPKPALEAFMIVKLGALFIAGNVLTVDRRSWRGTKLHASGGIFPASPTHRVPSLIQDHFKLSVPEVSRRTRDAEFGVPPRFLAALRRRGKI